MNKIETKREITTRQVIAYMDNYDEAVSTMFKLMEGIEDLLKIVPSKYDKRRVIELASTDNNTLKDFANVSSKGADIIKTTISNVYSIKSQIVNNKAHKDLIDLVEQLDAKIFLKSILNRNSNILSEAFHDVAIFNAVTISLIHNTTNLIYVLTDDKIGAYATKGQWLPFTIIRNDMRRDDLKDAMEAIPYMPLHDLSSSSEVTTWCGYMIDYQSMEDAVETALECFKISAAYIKTPGPAMELKAKPLWGKLRTQISVN